MTYTPTTEKVRGIYANYFGLATYRPQEHAESLNEFDRWLEAHDREVKAQAWQEGYWLGINGHTGPGNPYTITNAAQQLKEQP